MHNARYIICVASMLLAQSAGALKTKVPCYDMYVLQETEPVTGVFSGFTGLETERLAMRKVQPDDLGAIHAIVSDPEVVQHTASIELSTSEQDTRELIENILNRYAADQAARWAVVHKSTQEVIGLCGFGDYVPVFSRGEIGYVLNKKYWGQGFATEAAQAVIDFGFTVLGLNRIEGTCDIQNNGSARVLEKLGMTQEGILRQHVMCKGKARDRKLFSLLKTEWQDKHHNVDLTKVLKK